MNTLTKIAFIPFSLLIAFNIYAKNNDGTANNIELYFNGAPKANSGTPPPKIKAFKDFCGTTCFPTTTFPLVNQTKEKIVGKARIWGNNFQFSSDGNTICFTEFIEYKLKHGTIYTLGRTAGTCGTYMDSTLVPPMNVPGAEELAGGGDGNIVGGTERYTGIKGTFNDRVFVEFLNRTTIVYYDALFFNLMPDDKKYKHYIYDDM